MIPYGCIEPYRNLHMKVFAMLLNIVTTEIGKNAEKKRTEGTDPYRGKRNFEQ